MRGAASYGGILRQRGRIATEKHPADRRQGVREPLRQVVLGQAHHDEVGLERASGESERNPVGKAGGKPGDLLDNHRRRPQWQQQRTRRGPQLLRDVKQPSGGLDRVRQVTTEGVVVLAHHDAVEADVFGKSALREQLVDDRRGVKVEMRVEPERDAARAKCASHVGHNAVNLPPSTTIVWPVM